MFLFIFNDVINTEPNLFLTILINGLITYNFNNIANNLDGFVFSENQNRQPNWVAHLVTQRFQLTRIKAVPRISQYV